MGSGGHMSTTSLMVVCVVVSACCTGAGIGLGWWIGSSSADDDVPVAPTTVPTQTPTQGPTQGPSTEAPVPEFSVKFGQSHYVTVSNEKIGNLRLFSKDGDPLLVIDAGMVVSGSSAGRIQYQECEYTDSDRVCVEFFNKDHLKARLTVTEADDECLQVWWFTSEMPELTDCVHMQGASNHTYWYGGSEVYQQTWPINEMTHRMQEYTTNDIYKLRWGGVQERYWVSSSGVAIVADNKIPLHVGIDGSLGMMCFTSRYQNSIYSYWDDVIINLKYKVCSGVKVGYNVLDVHRMVTNKVFDKPTGIPDDRMFRSPVFSTWAQYKKNITQELVMEYAQEILDSGFPHSQLEIDDDWATAYGDWEFDSGKFPDPVAMVNQLHAMDFRVTVWTHPFANTDSQIFSTGTEAGMWVKDKDRGGVPALTRWWNGVGAILDSSNPAALEWFVQNLKDFKVRYGVDSFKFDAGETNWLPETFALRGMPYPNKFSELYCEACAQLGPMIEVRTGAGSQRLPVFVRVMDKDSRWGYNNGLRTLIPCTLTFGLLGYPFVLPDMIGGNAYGLAGSSSSGLPDKELYIRWVEANALLPSLQFSITPWQYGDVEVTRIARAMVDLHTQYTPLILELAHNATVTGDPIVRPLWWIAPTDIDALECDSQFLLGNDVLVAPVLRKNARSRNIYLPTGSWHDELKSSIIEGPVWLNDYDVALDELAYFTRQM
ncbi:PREDICTED: uncharacterized family 31 glucosidase KIAA1161-like [Priapulus caudatus]|uniref:Uncharacterized family 31 glucosidase KIAA1161-like n=1 Tax=Priapulus caudatus TaxID=37621 RepID=A0ABM1E8Q9_PRICU|nr:PREDICTED: uncharacterized family 31 glucosidase KIAA1161-like [Priapulus caudatus]XP_014668582.1 PREDICTED: uncharacterized family 31 glucosidase KIAA1161-like [Priapulus caudatus]XP_014668583.1 PREDICTED: uncharacterized family 31 glucosidase KIAA1161-like [Priapulus caudatus]